MWIFHVNQRELKTIKPMLLSHDYFRDSAHLCYLLSSGLVWPMGRLTGVPETTTEDALPWYPTGKWTLLITSFQFIEWWKFSTHTLVLTVCVFSFHFHIVCFIQVYPWCVTNKQLTGLIIVNHPSLKSQGQLLYERLVSKETVVWHRWEV